MPYYIITKTLHYGGFTLADGPGYYRSSCSFRMRYAAEYRCELALNIFSSNQFLWHEIKSKNLWIIENEASADTVQVGTHDFRGLSSMVIELSTKDEHSGYLIELISCFPLLFSKSDFEFERSYQRFSILD